MANNNNNENNNNNNNMCVCIIDVLLRGERSIGSGSNVKGNDIGIQ
jgi:hypothetical protein